MMETFFSNSAHPGIPRRSYEPLPVTRAEFTSAVNQIEVEHQKNAEFLMNPYPTHEYDEFHKLASIALQAAKDLSIRETGGVRPERMHLAHGQEVILYGTSRLRAAVDAWIEAVQTDENYSQSRHRWMSGLMFELVSDLHGSALITSLTLA
jgi:hypothetical protein